MVLQTISFSLTTYSRQLQHTILVRLLYIYMWAYLYCILLTDKESEIQQKIMIMMTMTMTMTMVMMTIWMPLRMMECLRLFRERRFGYSAFKGNVYACWGWIYFFDRGQSWGFVEGSIQVRKEDREIFSNLYVISNQR